MEQEVTFNEYGNTQQNLLLKQPPNKEVIRMQNTENIRIDENTLVLNDEYILYEINGVAYSLNELKAFIETSNELSRKLERQTRFNRILKLDNSALTLERNKLCDKCTAQSKKIQELECEIHDMKFTHKMLNSEEAGRAFARELLGKPMTATNTGERLMENGVNTTGDDY